MTIIRSYLLPHLAYVALLALITGVGIWRGGNHLLFLQQASERMGRVTDDLRRIDELHLTLIRCQRELDTVTQVALVPRVIPPVGQLREATAVLAEQLALGAHESANLATNPDFTELQQQVQDAESVLGMLADPQPGEDPAAQLRQVDQDFRQIFAAWSELSSWAQRELSKQSGLLLGRERHILNEASITFVVLVVMALTYLYAVNYYLTKPISDLARTMRAVTNHDLRARAVPHGDGPIADLANDFNQMVEILIVSLHEEQKLVKELQARTRDLEAANKHKSHFLANVSHELKTPLNAIIGFADILGTGCHGPLTAKQDDYLKRIYTAGNHLLRMITDLIDVAKIDLGSLSFHFTPFAPGALVQEVAAMLAPQVQAKRLDFSCTIPPDLSEVELDRTRVQQILVNLVANAIKFTAENGRITVSATTADGTLTLTVKDTGIGIAKKDQQRIFEDFVQLDPDLHRQHEGAGIGLGLSRRLAELMGGTITVESAPGKGSTFRVTLPVRHVPTPPPASGSENT